MGKIKKFLLTERDIPKNGIMLWLICQISLCPFHPAPSPITEDLYPLFAKVSTSKSMKDVWTTSGREAEKYKIYRPAPLVAHMVWRSGYTGSFISRMKV